MYLNKTLIRQLYVCANVVRAIVIKLLKQNTKTTKQTYKIAYNLPMWTSVDELHQIKN